MARNNQPLTERLPLAAGAIFGTVAFVWGYLLTLVLVALVESDDFKSALVESSGWLFYNAQLADIEIFDSFSFNYLTDSTIMGESVGLQLPSVVYHLVPIVCLFLAGFTLARYADSRTPQDGAIAGGTVLLGTLPLSIAGSFVFTFDQNGLKIAPVLTDSILFVGILFPLLFGAAGGVMSTRL